MSEIMIQTDQLTKTYGNVCAVDNVSLTVQKGSIVGLVGKNGAGKTTLIRLLTGLAQPTSGSFSVMPNGRTSTSVAAIVERPSIYLNMTAMDNLILQCKLLNIVPDADYLKKTLDLVGLSWENTLRAKNYSLGMQQRLAIAMTLVGKPELLILDEPTNGLDPEGIHHIREVFVQLNKNYGTTIIVSSHILSELSKFATEFFFMEKGSLIKHATAAELETLSAKRLRLTVSDVAHALELLNTMGKAEAVSADAVDFIGDVPPTQIILELAKENVSVSNILNIGDSLEDFFISLIGGAK